MTFSLDKGLGRLRYLTAGLTLFAVKIAIDVLVARAFGRPYSILYYISPSDSPLFHPSENSAYWLSMWVVALPFIGVGFVLTIRRLRDTGLSFWLALLFFAPFANIMFFGFCALVPGTDNGTWRPDGDVGVPVRLPYGLAAVSAAAVGALVGLSAFAVAVTFLQSYGGALFIGAPPIAGFVSGLLFARWHRPKISGAILTAMLALLLAGIVIVGYALEGLICLAMALPLVVLGSAMGAGIGCLLQRCAPGGGMAPTATAFLLLPLTLAVERFSPLPAGESLPVESSIIVDAPVETVWRHVVAFAPLEPPTEWIFQAGIAAPMAAVIQGEGVGALRECVFTTGSFVEPIEVWDPPRQLRFTVASSPDPISEWTLWDGPRPPHLDGYLQSTRGQFLLEPLPGARTRLAGRTWYRTNMAPEGYWRLWATPIVRAIHLRVLRHVAALSESAARESTAATHDRAIASPVAVAHSRALNHSAAERPGSDPDGKQSSRMRE